MLVASVVLLVLAGMALAAVGLAAGLVVVVLAKFAENLRRL